VRVYGKISENVKKNILHIFSSTALLLWNDQGSSRWCRLCSWRLSFWRSKCWWLFEL